VRILEAAHRVELCVESSEALNPVLRAFRRAARRRERIVELQRDFVQ